MTPNHLRYFISLVKNQSFTKASDDLFVSQSTISKSLKSLEKDLGAELIDRSASHFQLTPEGEIFYRYALEVSAYLAESRRKLDLALKQTGEKIRLGLPPTSGSAYFYKVLMDFARAYPHVDLEIDDSPSLKIVEKLRERSLDLGLVVSPFDDKDFNKKTIFKSESALLISFDHPLADAGVAGREVLRELDFVNVTDDFMYSQVLVNYCRDLGFEPRIVLKSSQLDLLAEAICQGRGAALCPLPLYDKFLKGRVQLIPLEVPLVWALVLVHLKNKILTQPMKDFIDLAAMD